MAVGGDLAEYVKNASTVIDSSNYNEIDGLVFANLSYVKFEDVSWTRTELEHGITVQQFAQKICDHLTNNNTMCPNNRDQYEFLSQIANSNRYSKCSVTNLAAMNGNSMWSCGRVSNLNEDAQWGAMTINFNDGSESSVVAMRGTDSSSYGWEEDFEIGYEPGGTTAQRLSRDYLKSCDADHIFLTGHSKGGNDVSSAYMMSDKSIRDRVEKISNYDGPGQNPEFIDSYPDAYKELDSKQDNYYPRNTVIGKLLVDNPGRDHYVSADTTGHTEIAIIGEHDPYSWNVNEGFNKTQSEVSKLINRVTDSALAGLSGNERANVMRALISIGIPAFISDEKNMDAVEIDYSTFMGFLQSAVQYGFSSPEEIWALLKLIRDLFAELAVYGLIKCRDFTIPGYEEFQYWIKDIFADFFRKYKNAAEDLWNKFVNKVGWIFGNQHEENQTTSTTVYDFDNHDQGEYYSMIAGNTRFTIVLPEIRQCSARLNDMQKNCESYMNEAKECIENIPIYGRYIRMIPKWVIYQNFGSCSQRIGALKDGLDRAVQKYTDSETNVICHIGL